MLDKLPPKFWKIFPLVLYGVFVASGITLIVFGAVILSKAKSESDVLGFAEAGFTAGGRMSISIGVTDFLTGVFGFVVTLLNKKWLYSIFAGAMIVMVLLNLFTFFALVLESGEDWRETSTKLKKLVTEVYGNSSNPARPKFDKLVDDLQRDTPCCGFSADKNENIFLKTAWHSTHADRTLPDSCCSKSHSEACFKAQDIMKARDEGAVFRNDCVNELYKDFDKQMMMVFFEVTMSTLMQVISATFTVLLIIYGLEESQ